MPYTPNYAYLARGPPPFSHPYAFSNSASLDTPPPTASPARHLATQVDEEQLDRLLRPLVLPVMGQEPVEALHTVRRLGLRERIAELLTQLEMREQLHRAVTGRLKGVSLDVRSEIVGLECFPPFRDAAIDQRRAQLETRLEGLYREATREQQDFWKEQRDLREQLVERLGEYRLLAWRGHLLAAPSYGAEAAGR